MFCDCSIEIYFIQRPRISEVARVYNSRKSEVGWRFSGCEKLTEKAQIPMILYLEGILYPLLTHLLNK